MIRSLRRFAAAVLPILAVVSVLPAQTYPRGNDPRDGLGVGYTYPGIALEGMRLLSSKPKPTVLDSLNGLEFINSDLAFRGNVVYQGNFAGFTIWDVSNPASPKILSVVECITAQGDPSIIGHLLFISAEGGGNRNDCAKGGVKDAADRMMGVRIYDVADPRHPVLVKNVQTCKGSHTHTVVPDPKDPGVIYLYVSGFANARNDLPGCVNGTDPADTTNSLFRLDVIRVPLAHPEQSEVVTGARIFTGIGAGTGTGAGRGATAPRNCHDVTAYPAMGLLAGACASHGLMVDISDPLHPRRLDAVSDTNFSLWHTAVFSNDGRQVVFTDEWGGGTQPMCQKKSMLEMGGNTVLTIGERGKMTQHAYFKIPTAQTAEENCVSHNGGLIPVPGRNIMVQGWYQGGVDVFDFTDPDHPYEIAYFDRGPIDPAPTPGDTTRFPRRTIGGSWGAYWYNGLIYSSELARGFDILELLPSRYLSANELAAAKLVHLDEYNPQSQPHLTWPAAFPVVRSYLDQLVRGNGLAAARTTAIGRALDAAEAKSGAPRAAALRVLAGQVDRDLAQARDKARVRELAKEIRRLADAR